MREGFRYTVRLSRLIRKVVTEFGSVKERARQTKAARVKVSKDRVKRRAGNSYQPRFHRPGEKVPIGFAPFRYP